MCIGYIHFIHSTKYALNIAHLSLFVCVRVWDILRKIIEHGCINARSFNISCVSILFTCFLQTVFPFELVKDLIPPT